MDDFHDLDGEIDEKQHAKLIENVLGLNKRLQLKKPSRTEPTLKVSEFNLVKSITGKQGTVHVNDLTKALKKRAKHVEIGKKVRSTERKAKILPKPLEKPHAQRIKRNIAYQSVKKNLDRWDAIVTKNRSAHHLPFPIPSKLKLYTTGETIKEFNSRNSGAEKHYPLTMQEILERRKEIAKMRAVQSYTEAKARRQSKIKSKKYHRVQRKEKIKNQIKEFEQLQITNPEEALKKLEEIERVRAQERASLRHHSTGKWAQSKLVRAKYDKDSRQVLAQQLAISRDLKQKLQKNQDDESDEDQPTNLNALPISTNNPWTNPIQESNEVTEFVESYKKFWKNVKEPASKDIGTNVIQSLNEQASNLNEDVQMTEVTSTSNTAPQNLTKEKPTKRTKIKQILKKVPVKNIKNSPKYLGTTEWDVGTLSNDEADNTPQIESIDFESVFDKYQKKLQKQIDDKYKTLKTRSVPNESAKSNPHKTKKTKSKNKRKVEIPLKDERLHIDENPTEHNENVNQELHVLKSILNSSEKFVDSSKSGAIKTTAVNLNTDIPDLFSLEDNEENIDQKGTITEAFEDDDIVEEFHKEKQAEIDSEKPTDIDLNLPGWGNWGGVGIKASKRKNKRLIIKFPKQFKRRDDNKHDVFINEKSNQKIKKHMVSEVPFPFKNVKDYEASIRAPIGETFVPELAFKKMIKPAVTTKMGAIIEPMSEEILID